MIFLFSTSVVLRKINHILFLFWKKMMPCKLQVSMFPVLVYIYIYREILCTYRCRVKLSTQMFLGFLDDTEILLMDIWTWIHYFTLNRNYLSYQWLFSVLLSNVSVDIFMGWLNSERGLSFSYIEIAVSDHPRWD